MPRASTSALAAALVAAVVSTALGAFGPSAVEASNPSPTDPMTIRFEIGIHTGYTFTSSGVITGSKTVSFGSLTKAETTRRASIPGRGVHLLVSTGTLAGYYVRESIVAYIPRAAAQRAYSAPVRISFPAGTVMGYRYDSSWSLVSAA